MSGMMVLALGLSLIVGVSLGLLGSGGSVTMNPILIYVAQVPVHKATPMSLAIVGTTSLIGLILSARQNWLDYSTILWIGLGGLIGAKPGTMLNHYTPATMLIGIFGLFMIVAGGRMLGRRSCEEKEVKRSNGLLLVAGAIISFLTNFLGIGGGFVIIPILVLLTGISMRKAVGTSLAIITLNCVYGVILQSYDGNIPDISLTLQFTLAAAIGMIATHRFAGKFEDQMLRKLFAWLVLIIGVGMIANAGYRVVHPKPESPNLPTA